MMGVISASGLIYRDFLQYILPTIIGLTLFAPLASPPGSAVDIEKLILLAFVLGYIIFSPVANIAEWVHGWLPLRPRLVRQLRQVRRWWAENWDYDQLWAALDKDEREYLYATASYIHFFRISMLYCLAYALANLVLVGQAAWSAARAAPPGAIISVVAAVRTPTVGNWMAPAWLAALVAFVLCGYLYTNALEESDILFGEAGFYPKFSEKYQRQAGGIASGVWGRLVQEGGAPLAGIRLRLLRGDDSQIVVAVSGEKGEFQFQKAFRQCVGRPCLVQVEHPQWAAQAELNFGEKSVPEVQLAARQRK